jgi:ankyrin repeat protein
VVADELTRVLAKIAGFTDFFDKNSTETNLVDVNQKDWTGDSPLHIAVRSGDLNDVQVLSRNGADINARGEQGMTALHYAAARGDIEIARALIDFGADVTIKDNDGRTASDWAATAEKHDVVALLKGRNTG